jgi:hypothetical protein
VLLLFGGIGIPAVFSDGHFLYRKVRAKWDKAGVWGVKVRDRK